MLYKFLICLMVVGRTGTVDMTEVVWHGPRTVFIF